MLTSFRTLTFCLLAAGMTVGCGDDSPSAPTSPINSTFTLAPGQSVPLPEANTVLTFRTVTEDSRCGIAANCLQVGQAVIELGLLIGGDATMPFELATSPNRQSTRIGDLQVTLENVSPFPVGSSAEIPPTDYRVKVRVHRP